MGLKAFTTALFTDADNDGEIVSVLGALSVAVFLALAVYTTVHTGQFQYIEYGTAIGLMLAGLGGGYFAKGKTSSGNSKAL